jgi:adenosylcobinamide-phosphate synthase
MLGYHAGPLEYFGKLAARLDDLANLDPCAARALTIIIAAGSRAASWTVDAARPLRHRQPQRGWTMAATAGALDLTARQAHILHLGTARARGR